MVSKDLSLKQRQREAEAKKTTGDAKTRRERVKEAEKKVKEAHEQKTALEDMMGDTVDAYVYPLAYADCCEHVAANQSRSRWPYARQEGY